MAGGRPGGPVQGVTSRSAFNYHDFSVRPAADLNGKPSLTLPTAPIAQSSTKPTTTGRWIRLSTSAMGEAFGEARSKREYFGHKPVPEVGLYYSSRSRDWFGWDDAPGRYMLGFWAAHRALVQAHIPLGMIMDENLSMERLRQFPVVYLANTAIVTEEEAAIFDEYVSGGGRLLVTGLTGNYDRYGKLRDKNFSRTCWGRGGEMSH